MRDRARLCLTMAASVSAACAGRAPAAQATAVPVVVAVAARKDVPVQVQAIGTVEPFSTVTVKPQVGGVIDTVHFREGADVRAGDLLFTIDRRPFQAAVLCARLPELEGEHAIRARNYAALTKLVEGISADTGDRQSTRVS